ncbi:MAG TPA: DNA-3-methyladenine glycosylase I [Polyangia bacterium]|nr:DNA-3-methyladenine glycosylase I [Polyangia bacterium]
MTVTRCPWPSDNPQMIDYHDREWGVPLDDDRALFGKLILDGFQAGLSWSIILRKRDAFERAFNKFDPAKMARFDARKIAALMNDAGIVRNRAKIEASVVSARAYLALVEKQGRFAPWLWQFVGGAPKVNHWKRIGQLPTESAESRAMSEALKEHGFKFCGPTICYAFMQAVGMVNDHMVGCFRHAELAGAAARARSKAPSR